MGVHDKFLPMIQRLIAKNGRAVKFIELNAAPANPSFPFEGPTDPAAVPTRTLTTSGCFVEPDSLIRLGITTKVEELLQRSDRIMLAPGSNDLSGYNTVVDEGETYKITGIETLRPGTTTLLHFVGVMR
jgi:hypothetical protein